MTETQLKTKVIKMLRKDFPEIFFWKENNCFISGLPDLVLCIRGKFVAIELKIPTGKIEKLQVWTLNQITKAGGYATLCYTVDEVKKYLTKIIEGV